MQRYKNKFTKQLFVEKYFLILIFCSADCYILCLSYVYSIFILYLSYIYPIFIVCCRLLEGWFIRWFSWRWYCATSSRPLGREVLFFRRRLAKARPRSGYYMCVLFEDLLKRIFRIFRNASLFWIFRSNDRLDTACRVLTKKQYRLLLSILRE